MGTRRPKKERRVAEYFFRRKPYILKPKRFETKSIKKIALKNPEYCPSTIGVGAHDSTNKE